MQLLISVLLFVVSITYITFYTYEFHKYLCKVSYDYPFQDPTLPIDTRLDNLMSLLTLEEKVIIVIYTFTIILLIITIVASLLLFLRLICYGWME